MNVMNIDLVFTLFWLQTTFSTAANMCRWSRYKSGSYEIYLKFFFTPLKWKDARKRCEQYGGQLVIVRDDGMVSYIADKMSKRRGYKYWMGLYVKDLKYHLVDGSTLEDGDYQKLRSNGRPKANTCGVTMWDTTRDLWVTENCLYRRNFLCEAAVPCSSRPAMIVNGADAVLENTTVSLTMAQKALFLCFASGYTANVTGVKLSCTWTMKRVSSVRKAISMSVFIDVSSHGERCECQSSLTNGLTEKSTIKINFISNPTFLGYDANDKIYKSKTAQRFVRLFDIYANPTPTDFELTLNGSKATVGSYNLTMKPLGRPKQHRVKIIMYQLSQNQSGNYVMTVANGIGKALEYRFSLQVFEVMQYAISDKFPRRKRLPRVKNLGYYFVTFGLSIASVLLFLTITHAVYRAWKAILTEDA